LIGLGEWFKGGVGGTMLGLRGLVLLVLLIGSSVVTLVLMGLSQWIQAILVIAVELCLGILLHEILEGSQQQRRKERPRATKQVPTTHRRKTPAGQLKKPSRLGNHEDSDPDRTYSPICRLLYPVRDSELAHLEFAIRECRVHRAELDLLFVRKMAPFLMTASSPMTETDDPEAHTVIERARHIAELQGIPFQASYAVSIDPSATILEVTVERQAHLLVLPAPRYSSLMAKWKGEDNLQNLLKSLPTNVSVLIRS
jgi:hypothetical protein